MAKKNSVVNNQTRFSDLQERDFWSFIDSVSSKQQCLSRSLSLSSAGTEKIYYSYDQFPFSLVLDAEACLHILYGRAFSDWVCGGQWSQMIKFLDNLIRSLRESNVCPLIYLHGSHDPSRFKEWVKHQKQMKINVNRVFRQLQRRSLPPPKAWWVPPSGLRSVLRLGLCTLSNPVFSSLDDHYLDMMDFVWKNNFQGVLGNHQDLVFFKPLRLFSARSLRLTKELNVLSTEYNLEGVAKSLDLNPVRFCLLGALLGNHILTPTDLSDFHAFLVPDFKHGKSTPALNDKVIRAVINYVRKLPSIDDYVKIGQDVFQSAEDDEGSSDPRFKKLKESVEYYAQGTRDPIQRQGTLEPLFQRGKLYSKPKEGILHSPKEESPQNNNSNISSNNQSLVVLNKNNDESSPDQNLSNGFEEDIIPSPPPTNAATEDGDESLVHSENSGSTHEEDDKTMAKDEESTNEADSSIKLLPIPEEVRRTAAERHRHGAMCPFIYQVISYGEIKFPVILENMRSSSGDLPRIHDFYRPLRQSVYAILFNLHHHQFALRQREEARRSLESSISVLTAKSSSGEEELPPAERSEIEAKLEDLQRELNELDEGVDEEDPSVRIREWVPYNSYQSPVMTSAREVPWGIPTIQRLWFGTSVEDKEKRIRAFMSCMRCDDVKPLLLQSSRVPAHLLVMATVLRYIMVNSLSPPLLRKPELDVFLLTSLKVGSFPPPPPTSSDAVSPRGVQLASLFMEGVEMAIFANDVCGAPLPLRLICPWSFFNGALFQSLLRKAATVRNLYELTGRNQELVSRIEGLKSAIIPELMNEGLYHPKRNNGGHAPWHYAQQHPPPFAGANGRFLPRKKGKGKSVSVVKAKKSEGKTRSSPIKTKEMNGESSSTLAVH